MFFTYKLHLPELKYLYYTVHLRKTKYFNKRHILVLGGQLI